MDAGGVERDFEATAFQPYPLTVALVQECVGAIKGRREVGCIDPNGSYAIVTPNTAVAANPHYLRGSRKSCEHEPLPARQRPPGTERASLPVHDWELPVEHLKCDRTAAVYALELELIVIQPCDGIQGERNAKTTDQSGCDPAAARHVPLPSNHASDPNDAADRLWQW